MRPRQATGRPGTAVIPQYWEDGHRPVVEKTLRGTAALRVPGTVQTWNNTTQQNDLTPHEPYATVGARVQALRGESRRIVVAEDLEVVADYLIVIPGDVNPATTDLVTVSGTDDALLDGRVFQIQQVELGTERFERDLFCTLTD